MKRSLEKIEADDLKRLLQLARGDLECFFQKNPKYIEEYKDKEVIVVLGQGGALHYIDRRNGVKDCDVWFFFPEGKFPLPYRRRGQVDFGESIFGVYPDDKGYKGRRIDVLMRSDRYFNTGSPSDCLVNYLKYKNNKTSNLLSQKAMVGLWPENLFGKIIWRSKNSFELTP